MIESIKHKGLKRLYREKRPQRNLARSGGQGAENSFRFGSGGRPGDMALPLFRFHPLTGNRRGTYSVTVKANWRVTFSFRQGAACDVDLEDYH